MLFRVRSVYHSLSANCDPPQPTARVGCFSGLERYPPEPLKAPSLGAQYVSEVGRKAYVVAREVVDGGLGEHAVVCGISVSPLTSACVPKHDGLHSSSDFLSGGVLPAMMISFALPERRVLSVDL